MLSYIRQLADEIQAGVDPTVEITPTSAPVFLIYAVLLRTVGTDITASQVHDAWSAYRELTGEPSEFLVDFRDLPENVQRLDDPYVAAIRAVAARQPTS